MAIELTGDEVRAATASLMSYRLREGGFAQGRGGTLGEDFTSGTVPTLAKATETTERHAGEVADEFGQADETDRARLVTIAALRSAIELETSAPTWDPDRVRVWRDQLREYVAAIGAAAGGGETGTGQGMAAAYSFPEAFRPPLPLFDGEAWPYGAEVPWDPQRRLRW